jgi:hypothetical protein
MPTLYDWDFAICESGSGSVDAFFLTHVSIVNEELLVRFVTTQQVEQHRTRVAWVTRHYAWRFEDDPNWHTLMHLPVSSIVENLIE